MDSGDSGFIEVSRWSGRRGSNPRPSPWQGDALPLSYFRFWFTDYALCNEIVHIVNSGLWHIPSLRHLD